MRAGDRLEALRAGAQMQQVTIAADPELAIGGTAQGVPVVRRHAVVRAPPAHGRAVALAQAGVAAGPQAALEVQQRPVGQRARRQRRGPGHRGDRARGVHMPEPALVAHIHAVAAVACDALQVGHRQVGDAVQVAGVPRIQVPRRTDPDAPEGD